MKLPALGFCALFLAGAVGLDRNQIDDNKTKNETTATVGLADNGRGAFDLADFANEVSIVELDLTDTAGFARDELLARYGRSKAASGQFHLAAAAYAMFLDEFGLSHAYSERVVMRMADCLFPFKYDQIDVIHSASGPRLEPAWRMGFSPRPEHLRRAIHAYELAASAITGEHARASAMLKLGWVHRVLGDWDASTEAWDRCATNSAPTKSAADATWLAAENLAWTGQPRASVARLRRLAVEYPRDGRVAAVADRIEHLEAEAHRSPNWLSDPVTSLRTEIEERSAERTPSEVYRSVVRWLERQDNRAAMITVSRWACTQNGWPVRARIACRYDLFDALLRESASNDSHRREAAERLREIVSLAPSHTAAVLAAIRCYHLLNDLGQTDQADQVIDGITARVKGSRRWEPIVLTEQIESLLERGEKDSAKAVLEILAKSHPDYNVQERFDAAFAQAREEGSR